MNYKVIVINLNKDTDRLQSMKLQFDNLDIDFIRFDAINGKDYLNNSGHEIEYDKTLCKLKNGKELSNGELGCALSHKRCAEILISENEINNDLEYILICEDDILIKDKNFKKIIEKSISDNKVDNQWEYLQFDYQKPGIAWIISWFNQVISTYKIKLNLFSKIKHILYSISKIPFVVIYATLEGLRNRFYTGNINFHRDVYFAGCYLINIDGAKKLLSLSDKILYPADKIQNEAKKDKKVGLKIKYYCPLIIFQQRKRFTSNLGI